MSRLDSLIASRTTRRALRSALAAGAFAAAAGLAPGLDVLAGEEPPRTAASAPMKTDEPMAGEMKKPGMTKGDMKKAAEKKERDMKGMIEKEEKSMPQTPAKK